MIKYLQLLIILFALCISLNGQQKGVNRDTYQIKISKTDELIRIDGIIDEEVWQRADRAMNFRRVQPTDTGFAVAQTEVMLTYNQKNLFIAIICHDPNPGRRPVESLRRDFTFNRNDNFLVFMDTFNDQTNGFSFGITPAGSLWDGIQADGGTVNLNWDIKWRAAVKNYNDRWTAEFEIPFRSLRFQEGKREWGINFSRLDLKSNEKSSWAPMPRQFPTASLAYTGTLVWDEPLPKSHPVISLIPSASIKLTQTGSGSEDVTIKPDAGFDAKLILSTSMNLDVTVNPDYSQVEVDRQQANMDRFELFFPEKRQFYLENSDLFASLGTEGIRPFFSRRIGLGNPVVAGVRLSGNAGQGWRIGLMDIQTADKDEIPAANFAVGVLQKKIFSRSNITAFFLNKQLTSNNPNLTDEKLGFNRVAGFEYNLASKDNRWTGKTFYHRSFYSGENSDRSSAAAILKYSTQYLTASLNQTFVGGGFISETGYIRRKDYYEISPVFLYKFFPESKIIVNHGPGAKVTYITDTDFRLTDRTIQILYSFEFTDRSILTAEASENYIKLLTPFDPTNTGGDSLATGTVYKWKEGSITYTSDMRKSFNFSSGFKYGGYFNGKRLTLNGEFNYRYQPYGSISFTTTYNKIDLPSPYNSAELILIGPRIDLTFSNRLFFTAFVQYNNQIDNVNFNFRFQWRYAPVSDLFIVFTQNSYPGNLNLKNRGLVVKLSYWFN